MKWWGWRSPWSKAVVERLKCSWCDKRPCWSPEGSRTKQTTVFVPRMLQVQAVAAKLADKIQVQAVESPQPKECYLTVSGLECYLNCEKRVKNSTWCKKSDLHERMKNIQQDEWWVCTSCGRCASISRASKEWSPSIGDVRVSFGWSSGSSSRENETEWWLTWHQVCCEENNSENRKVWGRIARLARKMAKNDFNVWILPMRAGQYWNSSDARQARYRPSIYRGETRSVEVLSWSSCVDLG